MGNIRERVEDSSKDAALCVLDGLDECEEHSLEIFTTKLALISQSLKSRLKMITVSREFPERIPKAISNCSRIRLDTDLESEVKSGLQKFIAISVDNLAMEKAYPDESRTLVKKVLEELSGGTFLWVAFVIKELRNKARSKVEDCLSQLPRGLDGMYERMPLQIREDCRKAAVLILRWVTMAIRPLNLTELGTAKQVRNLAFEEVVRDHVGFCGYFSLVTNDHVSLVHQSAKDYLLSKETGTKRPSEFWIREEETNAEIAQRCLDYL